MSPAGRPKKIEVELAEKEQKKENYLFIDNLSSVMEKVEKDMAERKGNPSVIQDEDAGIVFINGEPCIVIDNSYLPHGEAQIVLQTRRVVREYVKLQNLIHNII